MRWHRIKTVLLHSRYHLAHSMETWMDVFWYPFIQVLVFGLIALYFAEGGGAERSQHIILGLVLWQVIAVGQYSVSLSVMWEVWSHSFSNLFISPLTMKEFMAGQMIVSFLKAVVVFLMAAILGGMFFKFSVFSLGWWLVIYFLELLVFAWASGMFILGLIFRYGVDIQSLAWSLIYLVQPLGAVFYPVEILPLWLQRIAYFFPTTFIFGAARSQLKGVIDWQQIHLATGVNLIYIVFGYWFMMRMLKRSKEAGAFVRMEV